MKCPNCEEGKIVFTVIGNTTIASCENDGCGIIFRVYVDTVNDLFMFRELKIKCMFKIGID